MLLIHPVNIGLLQILLPLTVNSWWKPTLVMSMRIYCSVLARIASK